MLIKKLTIDYFGKFKNREINLEQGINLIYGENESGKSTLHTFIKGVLFGIDPARGRAANTKDDIYNRYLPWEYPGAYGGSMDIRVGDKEYRCRRNFLASDKSFNVIDLDTGRDVDLEQGLISDLIPSLTESVYDNTISFKQLKSRPERALAIELGNYITNLSLSKSKEVDVSKALDQLTREKKKLIKEADQISKHMEGIYEKIQLGEGQMRELENLLKKWEASNKRLEELEEKITYSRQDVETNELAQIREFPIIMEKYRFYKNLTNQSKQLEKQINQVRPNNLMPFLALIPTYILILFLTRSWPIPAILLTSLILFSIVVYIYQDKKRVFTNKQESLFEEVKKIEDQRDLYHDLIMRYMQIFITEEELTEEAMYRLENEVGRRQEKLRKWEEVLKKNYGEEKISFEKLNWEIENLEGVEDDLIFYKEDYQESQKKFQELNVELEALELAIETISNISTDVHDSFGRELNIAVSRIIKQITSGKYCDLKIDENLLVKVGIADQYILMDMLSEGTIKQIYFALRLAVKDLIIGEEMPIILDDSFALYDDRRIGKALKELSKQKQVIIFTCHKREEKALRASGLRYNVIEL